MANAKPPRGRNAADDTTRSTAALNALKLKKVELDPLLDAWVQQPGENARNFGLFLMYRDLGRIRTIAQVADLATLSFPIVARTSRLNRWSERAGLWDAEQDRLTGIRLLADREEMARAHGKAARTLMEKAMERLKTLKPAEISPHALVLMLDTAARIERAALGLETMKGSATAAQTTVTVAATTADDGKPAMRVEVGVQHERIMATLDAMVQRMSPEQLAAGYEELTASAKEVTRELNAALPASPPPRP
jgi:hypothetical protein